jgi:hypothetical protein
VVPWCSTAVRSPGFWQAFVRVASRRAAWVRALAKAIQMASERLRRSPELGWLMVAGVMVALWVVVMSPGPCGSCGQRAAEGGGDLAGAAADVGDGAGQVVDHGGDGRVAADQRRGGRADGGAVVEVAAVLVCRVPEWQRGRFRGNAGRLRRGGLCGPGQRAPFPQYCPHAAMRGS